MPIHTGDIIDFLCTLSDEEQFRVTVRESLKGGLIAGVGAMCGGMLLGPMGIAIGGAIGGLCGATASKDFRPLSQVIASMPQYRKDQLASRVRQITTNIDATDLAMFAALVAGDICIRKRVVSELVDYIRNEMSLALIE